MGTVILKIVVLLLILTLPFIGTKRRRREFTKATKTEISSNYCVNENGKLARMDNQKV